MSSTNTKDWALPLRKVGTQDFNVSHERKENMRL